MKNPSFKKDLGCGEFYLAANKPFGWKKPILKEVEKPDFPKDVEDFLEELTQVYFIRESLELEMMISR